jgi:hypothetical protein
MLVPEPSLFEAEIAIPKLKKYKSLNNYKILTELIDAGHKTAWYEIHKIINSVWKKEKLPDQWKEFSFLQFIYSTECRT